MRPVRSEQWAASPVFDVPSTSELCDDDFAPHPARRTALLQNLSACADVRALRLRRDTRMQISAASLMQHFARFPFVQTVQLRNLMLHTSIQQTLPYPVCASISELVIRLWDEHNSSDALLEMLPCLPGLRVLDLLGVWPTEGRDSPLLVLSLMRLEDFSCSGIISVWTCARIIACSVHTLRDLRVTGLERHPSTPGLKQLARVLSNVAPTLRELELSVPDDAAFMASCDALCANLSRARSVSLESGSHHVLWDLARRLCPEFCGHLQLTRTRPAGMRLTMRASVDTDFLSSAGLRSLTISGFWIHWDSAEELFELCSARRIPCKLSGWDCGRTKLCLAPEVLQSTKLAPVRS